MRKHLFGIIFFICLLSSTEVGAQTFVHDQSEEYQWPTDTLVVDKLHQWQDFKFGIIIHWGIYSVPGMVESCQTTSDD